MTPFIVRAIRDVKKQEPNMLTFSRFDLITITSTETQGIYWFGELNQHKGWVFQSDVEKVTDAFGVVSHTTANDQFDEYGIKNGDIITVTNPYHQDWWEVQFSDKKILYPSVFISIVDNFCIEGIADFDHEGRCSNELSFKAADVISKITFFEGHDWFKGELDDGENGLFPRNFLTLALKPIMKAKVAVDYIGNESDELNLSIGQEIDVVEDLGNGWMKGICGDRHGIFPRSFVQILNGEVEEEEEACASDPPENVASDSKLTEQLTCGICLDYAEQAVETSCCHHIFCEECIRKVKNGSCPQCRNIFKILVAHLARRMIGEIETICPNKLCNLKTSRSELVYHLPKCQFRSYTCSLCQFSGLKEDLGAHLVGKHLDVTLNCCKTLFS